MQLLKNAGDGIFSWSTTSLYERRGCFLVVGCIAERSSPCSNGGIIPGNLYKELLVHICKVVISLDYWL